MPQEERYTLADALARDENDRIELIEGAPIMMAPPSRTHQRAGVREYWIVDLAGKSVQTFALEDGRYTAKDFGTAEYKLKVCVLDNCVIDLSQVFPE